MSFTSQVHVNLADLRAEVAVLTDIVYDDAQVFFTVRNRAMISVDACFRQRGGKTHTIRNMAVPI